jgi:hypothetical protein
VNVLTLLVLLVGAFGLDPEGVCAEVVTLCLQQVGGQVLCAVSVVEAESGAERGSWDTPESTLGDNAGEKLVGTMGFDSARLTLSIRLVPCGWPC